MNVSPAEAQLDCSCQSCHVVHQCTHRSQTMLMLACLRNAMQIQDAVCCFSDCWIVRFGCKHKYKLLKADVTCFEAARGASAFSAYTTYSCLPILLQRSRYTCMVAGTTVLHSGPGELSSEWGGPRRAPAAPSTPFRTAGRCLWRQTMPKQAHSHTSSCFNRRPPTLEPLEVKAPTIWRQPWAVICRSTREQTLTGGVHAQMTSHRSIRSFCLGPQQCAAVCTSPLASSRRRSASCSLTHTTSRVRRLFAMLLHREHHSYLASAQTDVPYWFVW
jgi:hypothetical protein